MDQLSCAIYGMGRAGRSLLVSLQNHQVPVTACFARRQTHERAKLDCSAPIFQDPSAFFARLQDARAQILFIAVPDDAIQKVAATLVGEVYLPPLLAHLSGALSYDALSLTAPRSLVAQFHPLASLDGEIAIPDATLTAICASTYVAERRLFELGHRLKLTPSVIKHGAQPIYHAAAVLTGNLSVSLIADSIELMKQAGIDPEIARQGLAKLLRSTADAVEKKPLRQALTGPIARGDVGTVKEHLSALRDMATHRDIQTLYGLLSAKLSALTQDTPQKEELNDLLKEFLRSDKSV